MGRLLNLQREPSRHEPPSRLFMKQNVMAATYFLPGGCSTGTASLTRLHQRNKCRQAAREAKAERKETPHPMSVLNCAPVICTRFGAQLQTGKQALHHGCKDVRTGSLCTFSNPLEPSANFKSVEITYAST
jgi:hypothetical protein